MVKGQKKNAYENNKHREPQQKCLVAYKKLLVHWG